MTTLPLGAIVADPSLHVCSQCGKPMLDFSAEDLNDPILMMQFRTLLATPGLVPKCFACICVMLGEDVPARLPSGRKILELWYSDPERPQT